MKNKQQHGNTVSTDEHLDTETEEVQSEKAKKDRILLHPLRDPHYDSNHAVW